MHHHHLFIFANPRNGGQGIILLHRAKEMEWTDDEIKAFNRNLFPSKFRKKNVVYANENVSEHMVANYMLAIEQGESQRIAIDGSIQRIHKDQRDKIFQALFPELYEFGQGEKEVHE